jgi:hypothetical protein
MDIELLYKLEILSYNCNFFFFFIEKSVIILIKNYNNLVYTYKISRWVFIN